MAIDTSVVVLIPGLMGSRFLWTDPDDPSSEAQLIWPPNAGDAVAGYRWNAQLLSGDLELDGIIREVCCDKIYAPLIAHLESWGFTEADGTLVLFPYDWRKSAIDAARQLAELVHNIGQRLPEPSIALLAHSLGGLIARYYLESGDQSLGFQPDAHVSQLILMATPNRGSSDPLISRLGGPPGVPTVSGEEIKRLEDDRRYPSAYELFPPRDDSFAHDSSDFDKPIDVYDSGTGLMPSRENRDSASVVHARLDLSKRGNVEYFCFFGQHHPTYGKVFLFGDPRGGFSLDMARTDEAQELGDDTVTVSSATLSGIGSDGSSSATHEKIFQDDDLLRVLAAKLGKPDHAAAISPRVQVFLSARALARGKPARAVIKYPNGLSTIRGELRLERMDPDGQKLRTLWRRNITPENAAVEHISSTIEPPKSPGGYRLLFQRADRSKPEAQDTFYISPSLRVRRRMREKEAVRRSAKRAKRK
jgi:phospholipase A1